LINEDVKLDKKSSEEKTSMGFDIIDSTDKQGDSSKQTPTNDDKEKEIQILSSMKETDGEDN